jgi:hypothetical protein
VRNDNPRIERGYFDKDTCAHPYVQKRISRPQCNKSIATLSANGTKRIRQRKLTLPHARATGIRTVWLCMCVLGLVDSLASAVLCPHVATWRSSPCNRPWRARGGADAEFYSFLNHGARRVGGGGGVPTLHPGRFTPRKETRYALYKQLGGPQGRCGRVRKILLPPGFDRWTVHPVASRHTDWAIAAHFISRTIITIIITQYTTTTRTLTDVTAAPLKIQVLRCGALATVSCYRRFERLLAPADTAQHTSRRPAP